jgi:UDP-2,4-diacetamido-2,4,6-trideoxy-beta-L-altropyranose hydrolase
MDDALLIRADASAQIGTGHVMRCLALAQAWQETGGYSTFAIVAMAPALEDRLKSEGMAVLHLAVEPGSSEDAAQTVSLAQQSRAAWVVVDGYHFGAAYQCALKAAGLRVLSIDDYGHARHYAADLVLNQNIYADESLYPSREPYTRLLLGTRYVLLRREFWRWRGWQREIPEIARKVLVTLGGSDPDNVTLKVIQALQQVSVEGLEAVVVAGGGNPHFETLQSAVRHSPCVIRLESNVTHMPELMAWADVAVSAGGSTCWELAFMGLPSIVLVLAGNQCPIVEGLAAASVACSLGWHDQVTLQTLLDSLNDLLHMTGIRARMSEFGKNLVDAYGCRRVAGVLFD